MWPEPLDDATIVAARGPREALDPRLPYAWLSEAEPTGFGDLATVSTIFLTNRECPFRCLMCDLWRYTLERSVAPGDIPHQIRHALDRLPAADHVKLYNAGNFFDARAIPKSDRPEIARLVSEFQTVVVENHPRLCGDAVREFANRLSGRLEVAMGLETVHPEVLPRLNKRMTATEFARASERLAGWGVAVRAFVLLCPPYLSGQEGVEWAVRSVEFAAQHGVGACTIIPTRAGNGILDRLEEAGQFESPTLNSLEFALATALRAAGGKTRVFADLWDADQLACCPRCRSRRLEAIARMNLTQRAETPASCVCRDV